MGVQLPPARRSDRRRCSACSSVAHTLACALAAGLLDLPAELLEAVLLELQTKERARCALVCRRLAQLTAASRSLWRELEVEHRGADPSASAMAHLLPFLASRGRHVESLMLSWGWLDAPADVASMRTAAVIAAAAAFCSPSLRVLSLRLPQHCNHPDHGRLPLDQWVAVLRRLEWLHVEWTGVTLTPHLSTLSQLRVRGGGGEGGGRG